MKKLILTSFVVVFVGFAAPNADAFLIEWNPVHSAQFSLNDGGYGAAGGDADIAGYLNTISGTEQRASDGSLVGGNIINPGFNVTGLANDGTDLYAYSDANEVKRFSLTNRVWDMDGMNLEGSAGRDLAATADYFFRTGADGKSILINNKTGGGLVATVDISSFVEQGYGIGAYDNASLAVSDMASDRVYAVSLNTDFTVEAYQSLSFASDLPFGVGINKVTGELIVNNAGGSGRIYAAISLPASVPIPGALYLFGSGLAGLVGLRRRGLLTLTGKPGVSGLTYGHL